MLKNLIIFSFIILLVNCEYKGIDVSVHQGNNVDFKKVKNSGVNFVIMRAGIGHGEKDKYFEINYKKAKAAGLNVGVYWYGKALSVEESTQEANLLLNALKGKQLEYPVYYDIEEKKLFAKGKTLTSNIAKNFCEIMQKHNYFCGIYASLSYFNNYFTDEVKKRFTIWVAQYNTRCDYKGDYKIWQRSSKGSVPGIKGNVDLDISYYDFPTLIKKKKMNGFK